MASQSELYSLAKSVGLSDSSAKIAAAVGMAESAPDGVNANANAHNTKPPDDSYGYWQINMLGSLGPARRAKYGLSSNAQLFDPATNARVMKGESLNGMSWFPWSTYNDGAYLKYLHNQVTDQSTNNPNWLSQLGSAVAAPITAPISAAQSLSGAVDTLAKTAKWVSNSENWLRVGYVAGGSVLVVVGLVMVLSSTKLGSAVSGLATGAPARRVVTVAKVAAKNRRWKETKTK